MSKKDMQARIWDAIWKCLEDYEYDFCVDEFDLEFMKDAIEDIVVILDDNKMPKKHLTKEEEIENMKEDEAMEEYYEKKSLN